MNSRNGRTSIQTIFILVQTVLYVGFLALDLTGGSIPASVALKYTIIILCFCYALPGADKSTFYLLQSALLFTLVSDLFILILDYYIYGVMTFIVAQELYCLRLTLLKNRSKAEEDASVDRRRKIGRAYFRRVLMQVLSSLVIYLLLYLVGVGMDELLIVSVFYFICILTNVISAITLAYRKPESKSNRLYAAGMLLFLLCDINVGVFNLSGFLSVPENVYTILYALSSILMWTFYAPAQVLIAISSRYEKKL